MGRFVDLSGGVYSRLTVLFRDGVNSNKRVTYLCQCECGNKTSVSGSHLKNGHTKSCGCLSSESTRARSATHGMTKTVLHTKWKNIKQRCTNSNLKQYKDYGGRGITLCEEWSNSFKLFYDWCVANGWAEGLEIDRVDNDKGYSPENCRFVEKGKNAMNKRSHKGSTSKYKGVSWNSSIGKWSCQIQRDGKNKHCGYFEDEIEAALKYNEKAKELFGEYAYLNSIVY